MSDSPQLQAIYQVALTRMNPERADELSRNVAQALTDVDTDADAGMRLGTPAKDQQVVIIEAALLHRWRHFDLIVGDERNDQEYGRWLLAVRMAKAWREAL